MSRAELTFITMPLAWAVPALALLASTPCHAQAQPASGPVAQLLSSARMWQYKHRPDIARGLVQKALLIDPDQPDALGLMGQIEILSNHADAAGKILDQLRKVAPNHPATQELADAYRIATTDKTEMANIRLLARMGKSADAVARLKKLFPNGAPRGDLARDYYRIMAGVDRDGVIAQLRERTAKNPSETDLQLVLGDLLTDRHATRLEGLSIIYRVYQRPDSDHTQALEMWKRALDANGQDEPAFYIWYKRYAQEVPDDASVQQAVSEMEAKGWARGAAAAAAAATAAESSTRSSGRSSSGGSAGGSSWSPRPQSASARQGAALGAQGLEKMRAGQHDDARELFTQALKFDPGEAGKWRSLIATATYWGNLAHARAANAQGHPDQAESYARAAIQVQPATPDAHQVLADALIAQQRWPDAEAELRPLLANNPPSMDALRSMITLLNASGRQGDIDPLIASTTARMGKANQDQQAELLSIEADRLISVNKTGPALERLENALRFTPDDAWLRYTLARQYRDLGLPLLGRAVMDEGLARPTPSADMRYASALYFNSTDDIDGASRVLGEVPTGDRSSGMQELSGNLAAQRVLRDARLLAAQGHQDQAAALLDKAAADAGDDPQMLATIGRQWISLGQPDKGLKLVSDWLAAHPDDPAIGVRLRYGDLLDSADRDDQLGAWIADTRTRPDITAEQNAQLDDQQLRLAIRTASRQTSAGDLRGATRTLDAVPAPLQANHRWRMARIDLLEAKHDYHGGAAIAQDLITADPTDLDARLALARMDEHLGKREEAAALVHAVQDDTPVDDVDTRLAIARRYLAQGDRANAVAVVAPLRAQYPDNPDVTVQAGRIAQAQSDYDQAASLYKAAIPQQQAEGDLPGVDGLTSSERALQNLDDRKQGQVATAYMQSNEAGTAGISRLDATTIPLYLRLPDGYSGAYFFHADSVLLDSGTLPADSYDASYPFGKIAALGSAGLAPVHENAQGVALAAGYDYSGENDSWRADVGTTPLGFPVTNILGGFLYRHDFSDSSLSVDVSRRANTSSLTSYAGVRDPVTGEVWGGVVRTGATVRGAQDWGSSTLFASVGYGVLTGRNVPSDNELRVRAGVDLPVFIHENQTLYSGLVLNYWQYSRNEHFYTFGNGGYYSPEAYRSISIPLDWSGRWRRWSWELVGSVGFSSTFEQDTPYYPNRPELQALAVQRMAAADLGTPIFGGGSGGGFSYTVGGSLEYRLTPHFVIGTRFQIDRSRDYAPNLGMLYLRYFFDRLHGPVWFPPRPVKPYSSY